MKTKITDAKDGLSWPDWLDQPMGQWVQSKESALLLEAVPNLFGYVALQVGYWGGTNEVFAQSRVRHKCLVLPPQVDCTSDCSHVVADMEYLPIATESVDVVVLPHTLESVHRPHHFLREIDRVLVAEGHVLILGFNPYSLWGLACQLPLAWQILPERLHLLSLSRVSDWLSLLGYDIVLARRHLYEPPLRQTHLFAHFDFLDAVGSRLWPQLAGGYMLLARKRRFGLTPLRPRWRPQRRLAAGKLVVGPSSRECCGEDE